MEATPRAQRGPAAMPPYFGADHTRHLEDMGAESESRIRRKFQKATTSNLHTPVAVNTSDASSFAFRKPTLPASATASRTITDLRLASTGQRRKPTLKDNRTPLGPRPLDSSSKRVFSESAATASYAAYASRSFLPNSSSAPSLDNANSVKSKDGRYSFGESEGSAASGASNTNQTSFDFLPPVSFDDFHTSIASYDSLPPAHMRNLSMGHPNPASNGFGFGKDSLQEPFTRRSMYVRDDMAQPTPIFPPFVSKNPKSQQFARNYSAIPRETSLPTFNSAPAVPQVQHAGLSFRTRGPSQIAPPMPTSAAATAAAAAARPPRKSVGPGLLGNMVQQDRRSHDSSAIAAANIPLGFSRTPSLSKANRRAATNPSIPAPEPAKSHTAPTKSSQARSMHAPLRSNPPAHVMQAEQNASATESPARKQSADAPVSLERRKSGRMSGLGARTISPTDARRLKRLSMMQAPPMPSTSPYRAPSREGRAITRSPSMIPRMPSVAPSSARETPESNAKAYPPSISLSRSSSYHSFRTASASSFSRIGQTSSMSKLPAPKSRNVHSSAERHVPEMVPPVPAIPKAYESPSDQMHAPFFSDVKLPLEGNLDAETALPSPSGRKAENPSTPSSDKNRHRRGLTTTDAVLNDRAPALTAQNKKPLQPLRLPPLNLLPLSTPTTARIASFPAPSDEVDRRRGSPSSRRNLAKTPSTPMTASKATFYRRQDDDSSQSQHARSNSSHHLLRGQFEEPDDGVPLPSPLSGKRQAITPFTSGSLPKPKSNFGQPKLPDEYTLGDDAVTPTNKPMGPRPRTASKSVKESNFSNTPPTNDDQEVQSTGTSLRRKLSLGWRRSSSKAATPSSEHSHDGQSSKPDEMPPPKIPASATWSVTTEAPRPSLDSSRRKPSVASTFNSNGPHEMTSNIKPPSNSNAATRQQQSASAQPQLAQRSSSWSILGAMNRNPSSKNIPPIPAQNKPTPVGQYEREEQLANDEMRKLSTKRKEVDTAARETEELRKRATCKNRMTPAQAVLSTAGLLNVFEKGEIIDFKESGVYFCGTKSAKKHVGDISAAGTTNYGYDDERGDYNIVMGDHLAYRYEVVDVLGKGSFGQVVRCIDHKNGGLCAVKIIRNKKRFHQQALVEVGILGKLRQWDPDEAHATLTISSSFYFRSHLCITSPCLSINLYEFIRAHNFAGFSISLIRRFSRQILACLCLLQTKCVIHCDLKPENILLCDPRRADVRVIDFGSSCKADEKVYTYIQSRFYRSPEVILGSEYGLGIDMWSLGCILAELFTGYPIFPGENEQEQLACIMEIFGPPQRDIIEKCSRRKLFFDSSLKPRVTVSSKGRRRRPSSKTLSGVLKCDDEPFLDFLAQCLRWDPEKRLRPDQAVMHPFITNEPMRKVQAEKPRLKSSNSTSASYNPLTATSSPLKRPHNTNETSQMPKVQQSTVQTPRSRPLPDTPATTIRMVNASPSKPAPRRQSTAPTNMNATNAAVYGFNPAIPASGSKRGSGGALLAAQHERNMASAGYNVSSVSGLASNGLPRAASGKAMDIASAAARESMRWR